MNSISIIENTMNLYKKNKTTTLYWFPLTNFSNSTVEYHFLRLPEEKDDEKE